MDVNAFESALSLAAWKSGLGSSSFLSYFLGQPSFSLYYITLVNNFRCVKLDALHLNVNTYVI